MDDFLWPARYVAEYAYCPRLYYYEHVEGTHIPSTDTIKGLAVHKNVDHPSASPNRKEDNGEEDPDRPRTVRSLALTSSTLCLTATLDLAELNGKKAIPIEYRKGRPQHIVQKQSLQDKACPIGGSTPKPWPTDRVQIGLQAILLEESGYEVSEAVIYYAAEKLRLKIIVDSTLKEEALKTLDSAKRCAKEPRPLPLVNDPRCPKCSLQPFCLPDEINYQRAKTKTEELTPRKIWPPRDDGIHVVAQQEGIKIGVSGMELKVTSKEGTVVKTIPLVNIESLSVLGPVQITTQAIHTLAERTVPIAYLTSSGRLTAIVDPLDSVSANVRKAQILQLNNPRVCIELTRALIYSKIINQRTLLMRNYPGLPKSVAASLLKEAKNAAQASSIDAVRGHEGQAAAIYFENFAGMFKGDLSLEFNNHGRQRRPPPDPINSCLSMGYTMLAHECVAALRIARLDPAIGGFHVSRPGRPAFALDLMEPFRPLIADSVAVTLFNKGELTAGHFMRTAAGCMFTDAGRKSFFRALGRRMSTEITHSVFDYRLSYRRMIILHARMIAAWLTGEIPTLSFLTTR